MNRLHFAMFTCQLMPFLCDIKKDEEKEKERKRNKKRKEPKEKNKEKERIKKKKLKETLNACVRVKRKSKIFAHKQPSVQNTA